MAPLFFFLFLSITVLDSEWVTVVVGTSGLIELIVSSVRANLENPAESDDAILGSVHCWAVNAKKSPSSPCWNYNRPGASGRVFFVFIVYSLFVAYYPRPIVYRVHPPRFLLFILIQLRHFSFIITTIYTATYSRQHLRRCHPIECDTEVFHYIFST